MILVLEDKLGITDGYMPAWNSMCLAAGLNPEMIRRYSVWKSPVVATNKLLIQKGNRKSPGFNPDEQVQSQLRNWLAHTMARVGARYIICMDVALLGLIESRWDIATIDHLRGGVYRFNGIKLLVTVPISAINTQKKPKDIRAMNDGAESKDEWDENQEEHEEGEFFLEPYTIPYGKFVLASDLRKLTAIINEDM